MRRILAVAALVALVVSPMSAQSAPRVTVQQGVAQGLTLPSGVRSFRGLPYAAAPVRELRWRPPQPAQRWPGVRLADRFANQCMQARVFGDMMFRNDGMSEDCLYLNVWQPATARSGAALPVLVYIYGGGFVAGDGSEPRYDGESMARRGIVVVTLSHRLGIFGFFAHPELAAESPEKATGNYGLMDQTAALRWVRDNIAVFGGDPNKVTIAGESAGSFSVSAQMATPLAKGLFARAIGESGALVGSSRMTPRRESERQGTLFATQAKVKTLAELRALSSTELLELSGRPTMPRFGPNVDGKFFPEQPDAIFANGAQARVPLLAGWNSEEMTGRALVRDITPATAKAFIAAQFGANADEAEKFFPVGTQEQAVQSLTDLAGDRFIGFSTWKWLEEHGRTSGQPVYRYLYARPRPATVESGVTANLAGGVSRDASAAPAPAATGAVHSAEIEYAMGNLPLNPVFAWTPDDFTVSKTLQGYFENFIKTGDPNGPGLPRWPTGMPNAAGEVQRMRIDVQSTVEPEPRARYQFLDRLGPPKM